MQTRSANATAEKALTLGLFGARGAVGQELIGLLKRHSSIGLSKAWSGSLAGEAVPGAPGLVYQLPDIASLRADAPDIVVLALPNGKAAGAVAALEESATPPRLIVDVSADYRFDSSWVYGLTELRRDQVRSATRIANPGCYATAMGLTLKPLLGLLASTPHCFGVSGYSGAGSTPSERNNVARLTGGVLPYASVGHLHEREVGFTLGRSVRFAPNVAPFERGIVLTALLELEKPGDPAVLEAALRDAYRDEPLIDVIGAEVPRVQDVVGTPRAVIGGIRVDPERPTSAAAVCVIDNLLKGAASQALQNINAALGLHELEGIV